MYNEQQMKPIDSFKTKKALKEFVSKWLSSLDRPITFQLDSVAGLWLHDLLKRHPNYDQKTKDGLRAFRVRDNSFGNGVATDLQTADGKWVDFSWVTCCNSRSKSNNERLTQAFREAVDIQILSYKNNRELHCDSCFATECKLHADHIEPFKDILKMFLSTYGNLVPNDFDDCPITNRPTFRQTNQVLKELWQRYHKDVARLQLLCIPCHLAKTKSS